MVSSKFPSFAAEAEDASNSHVTAPNFNHSCAGHSPKSGSPAANSAQETPLKQEIYGPYWVTHVLNKVTGQQDDEKPDWMREED